MLSIVIPPPFEQGSGVRSSLLEKGVTDEGPGAIDFTDLDALQEKLGRSHRGDLEE